MKSVPLARLRHAMVPFARFRHAMPVVVTLALLACASGSTASDVAEITPGEPFRLAVGEEMRLPSEDLTVHFSGVTGDSRCPTGVNCFWAGDAAAEMRLTRGDEETSVTVHTHGDQRFPRQAEAFGCTLHLEDLEPYPSSKRKIAPEDYVATLKLTVGEESSQ